MGDVGWPRAVSHGPVVAVGKLVVDVVLVLGREFERGGNVRVRRTVSAGGAPANVAAGLARLGVPVRMAGWAGSDPLAEELLAGLSARGVALAVVRRGRPPVATVLVHPDGERSMLTDAGEGGLRVDDVDPDWTADASIVHLDGYDLLPGRWPDALVATAERARAEGAAVSVDVAAANRIADVGAGVYADLLRRLRPDLLLCNAREAAVLGRDLTTLATVAVVHAGAGPTHVSVAGAELIVPVQPLPSDTVRDSTGCGDAFAAGVLAGWRAGESVRVAVERGHTAAAAVVGVLGGQPPV